MSEGRDIIEPAQWPQRNDKREPVLDPNTDPPRVVRYVGWRPAYGVAVSSSVGTLPGFACASPARMADGLKNGSPSVTTARPVRPRHSEPFLDNPSDAAAGRFLLA